MANQQTLICCAALLAALSPFSFSPGLATDSHILLDTAKQAIGKGDVAEALRLYTQYISANPHDPAGYIARASLSRTAGDEQSALDDYSQIIRLQPHSTTGYVGRAQTYMELKKNDLALLDIAAALRLRPSDLNSLAQRAAIYDAQHQYKKAIDGWTTLLQLLAGHQRKAYLRARAMDYEKLGSTEKALQDYAELATLSKQDDGAMLDTARAFERAGKFDRSIDYVNQAIAVFPDDDEAYKLRGDLYMRQKRYPLAVADYKKAVSLDPYDPVAKLALDEARKQLPTTGRN